MMNPIAIVQARLRNHRLPRKVLADICGKTLIERQMVRMLHADELYGIVVAIPDTPEEDELAEFCERKGWECYRGPEDDVLARYVGAMEKYRADPVVRMTMDCPLIDPGVINGLVRMYNNREYDYISNNMERTFPHGLDVEVIRPSALRQAAREATEPYDREHVTPYITSHRELFGCLNVTAPENLSQHRWTVDYNEDLKLMWAVYQAFRSRAFFTTADIIWLMERRPELMEINAHRRADWTPPTPEIVDLEGA